VVGLLLAIQYIAIHRASPTALIPARILLIFSGLATLGLNVAEPLTQGVDVRSTRRRAETTPAGSVG
jgi:hypothetical protein